MNGNLTKREKLASLFQEYKNNKSNELSRYIHDYMYSIVPSSLYKCRKCSDLHIKALKNNEIYFSPPSSFNNPMDTCLFFDVNLLEQKFFDYFYNKAFALQLPFYNLIFEYLKTNFNFDLKHFDVISDNKTIRPIIEGFIFMSNSLIRTHYKSACFSEDVKSIIMWSHYSDEHTGFALEYDTSDLRPYNKNGVYCPIFPIIYSNSRCDATEFGVEMMYSVLDNISNKLHNDTLEDDFLTTKVVISKSLHWEYEKEWRLLYDNMADTNKHYCIDKKPKAIYLGSKMLDENKSELRNIAKEKGIKIFEMYIDYNSNEYSMSYRELKF